MIRERYSPAAIFLVWSGLGAEGWAEHPALPAGWRTRGAGFLSPLMEEASSSEALLHLLAGSTDYNRGELAAASRAFPPT
jgi:hypothetical protein